MSKFEKLVLRALVILLQNQVHRSSVADGTIAIILDIAEEINGKDEL